MVISNLLNDDARLQLSHPHQPMRMHDESATANKVSYKHHHDNSLTTQVR